MDEHLWKKDFWYRTCFEFTPGRGQIHIHFLAIRKNQNILRLCHKALKKPNGKNHWDKLLAKWAEEQFGLTASAKTGFEDLSITPANSPCGGRLSDISANTTLLQQGVQNLIKFCQVHECNGFCSRKTQSQQYVLKL